MINIEDIAFEKRFKDIMEKRGLKAALAETCKGDIKTDMTRQVFINRLIAVREQQRINLIKWREGVANITDNTRRIKEGVPSATPGDTHEIILIHDRIKMGHATIHSIEKCLDQIQKTIDAMHNDTGSDARQQMLELYRKTNNGYVGDAARLTITDDELAAVL